VLIVTENCFQTEIFDYSKSHFPALKIVIKEYFFIFKKEKEDDKKNNENLMLLHNRILK